VSNYSFIRLKFSNHATQPKRTAAFEEVLKVCLAKTLDPRWQVSLAPWEDEGPTWQVILPGTACKGAEAMKKLLAPDEDAGFPVTLQTSAIAFRHSINMFTNWAQGRLAEQLADHFNKGVYFDSTDEIRPPRTKVYRAGKTFRDYLTHEFKRPLSKEDTAIVERYMQLAPEGHQA
jgi:hypothetical protein